MFLAPCVSAASVGRECNFTMISGTRKQISWLTYGIACMITSSAAVIKHWLVGWQISAIRILKHPDRNRFLPVSVEFFYQNI